MPAAQPQIMTVTGPIMADTLGPTLAHEHLWCDISPHSGREDNILNDVPAVAAELRSFQQAGGRSIIEVTPEGIGRSPLRLREIAEASGTTIVCGIAFYDQSVYPKWVWEADQSRIADYFTAALQVGEKGVRAGIIGELASHNEPEPNVEGYRLAPIEATIFRAAAATQRRTGAGITTHASLGRGGVAQLRLLADAGADLRRVAIGHCDAHVHDDIALDLSYYHAILRTGAFCQFDLIGWDQLMSDDARAERIALLVEQGFAGQILLSTDTCRRSQWRCNGGRGYDHLWTSFLPRLRNRGVSEADIKRMLIDAPRRLLAGTLADNLTATEP